MAETSTKGRVVRHLSIAYFVPVTNPDGGKAVLVRTARRGDTVHPEQFADGELERLDGLGALLGDGSTVQDLAEEQNAIIDLYRGQRGDTDALQRAVARAGDTVRADAAGGISDLTGPEDAGLPGPAQLADRITAEKLTVDDTVALAQGDSVRARRVLEAERLASGGSPRSGVEQGLQKLIGD